MEDLLCDEKWVFVMSPSSSPCRVLSKLNGSCDSSCESQDGAFEEEYSRSVGIFLEKEVGYMPDPGYTEIVREKDLVFARVRIMHWFIKSSSRLKLTYGTIFLAANCFDRFISIYRTQEWKHWMLELLSVSCLLVAMKFTETLPIAPSLHEIQVCPMVHSSAKMEDLDHSFECSTIQRMELTVLQALGWRLGAITAYSYVELFGCKPNFLSNRVDELLLHSLFDIELMKFRPSVIAAAVVLRCAMTIRGSDAFLVKLVRKMIPDDDRMGDVLECRKLMQFNSSNCGHSNNCPSSPVTVLVPGHIDVKDDILDLSLLETNNKRKKKMRVN